MSPTLIRPVSVLFFVLAAGQPAGAQDENGGRWDGSPHSVADHVAPQFPAYERVIPRSSDPDDANREPDFRILATTRVSTMERELNEAAAEGFRLVVVGDDIDSGEGLVDEIFALVLGDTRPGRFSYRLVTLKDLTTMEAERARALTAAAAEGFRYRGLVQAPLGGHAVVVLERDADTAIVPLEYLVIATTRLSTLEREIEEAASLGYRVMALTMNGGGAFDSNDRIAVLTRPHSADAPAGP
ncbi:MAG: hypothetical protein F4X11_16715 [Acidobacteria bacterium]|nr:hypothetical protein [Acidobacteriota bacterium]